MISRCCRAHVERVHDHYVCLGCGLPCELTQIEEEEPREDEPTSKK